MLVHDILIPAHGRARLCFPRMKSVYLPGGLVYQRKHSIERQTVLLQQMGTEGIHVIGEIAGKDSCHVQIGALCRSGLIHFRAQRRSHFLQHRELRLAIGFHEKGYRSKIHLPSLTERLHRIEHTVTASIVLPDLHRHAASRMHEQGSFPALHHSRYQFLKGGILDHHQIDIGIGTHRFQRRDERHPEAACQLRCRSLRAAVHLHHLPSGLLQAHTQMRGHISGTYQCYALTSFHTCPNESFPTADAPR